MAPLAPTASASAAILSRSVLVRGKKATTTAYTHFATNSPYTTSPRPFIIAPSSSSSSMTTATVTSLRSFSSSMKRDKYGRILKRRVIVMKDKNNKHHHHHQQQPNSNNEIVQNQKGPTTSQKKTKWPKLAKVLTPINVPLQPIQPPPIQPPTTLQAATKKLNLGNNPSSSSSSLKPTRPMNTAHHGTRKETGTKLTKPFNNNTTSSSTTTPRLSREKKLLSASTTPPTTQSKKLSKWLRQNFGTIILNLGSMATLTAFTRTDMMDLRLLSIVGSSSTMFYFLTRPPPLVYGPLVWSGIFLFTNSLMAYYIFEERQGKTRQLTVEEEDVYDEHFLPYGVTPRQYEKLLNIMEKVHLKRGEVLLVKDVTFDSVYLVTSGSTCGMTGLSRRVTAASSVKGNRDKLSGGDAGAWIGELAFLELLGDTSKREITAAESASVSLEKIVNSGSNNTTTTAANDDDDNDNTSVVKTLATTAVNALDRTNSRERMIETGGDPKQLIFKPRDPEDDEQPSTSSHTSHTKALLTYIATEDSVLYAWHFDELAKLLSTSAELRLAITRAMTAAVVHKVVNLYLSKENTESDTSLWKRWMEGVKNTADSMNEEAEKIEKLSNGNRRVHLNHPGTVEIAVHEKDQESQQK